MAIQSFSSSKNGKVTERFFVEGSLKKGIGWASLASNVMRKLDMLHYAAQLDDLRVPPNNRLEALRGDLKGFYSIRVNDQWRVVFRWTNSGPAEVEICDYH